jgi:hypothetical protein
MANWMNRILGLPDTDRQEYNTKRNTMDMIYRKTGYPTTSEQAMADAMPRTMPRNTTRNIPRVKVPIQDEREMMTIDSLFGLERPEFNEAKTTIGYMDRYREPNMPNQIASNRYKDSWNDRQDAMVSPVMLTTTGNYVASSQQPSDSYTKVREILKKGASSQLDKIKATLGDDLYNNIGRIVSSNGRALDPKDFDPWMRTYNRDGKEAVEGRYLERVRGSARNYMFE